MTARWGFTDRPCVTLGNAVFRGLIGGTGAKAAIVAAIDAGTFIPSPHGNGHGHTEATRITVGEASALQTFPHDYPWRGGVTVVGTQIGNAIPPTLARAVLATASGCVA